MGTTLVALLRSGSDAVLANVGDSRAYLLRARTSGRGRTIRISEDHTYAHLLSGADEVPNLPEKLARFLDGRRDGRSPDLTSFTLRPGDRVLLCTDGLSSYVSADVIHDVLAGSATAEEAAGRLVDAALDRGGPDNVTVLVLDS